MIRSTIERMRGVYVPPLVACVVVACSLLIGCASLGEWLDTPASGVQQGDGTVTATDPTTGVSVTAPKSTDQPVEIPVGEDGGTVTYTPPATDPNGVPTRGDTIADTAGGIGGMLLGNPMLGVLLSAGLKGAFALAGGRRRKAA